MNNYKQPKKIVHELEFGTVLDKAFNNYKKTVGVIGVSMLIMTIIYVAIVFGIMGIAFGVGDFTEMVTAFDFATYSAPLTVAYVVVAAVVSGIMTVIYAGFYKIADLANSNQPFEIGTTFYYFKSKHFLDLFVAGSLISVVSTSITLGIQHLSIEPMVLFFSAFIPYVLLFFTVLTSPLIIFSDLKALDAMGKSAELVAKNFFIVLGLLIIAFILAMAGVIALCIGIFFTLPFIYSMIYSIYSGIFPIERTNIIDEIGIREDD